MNESVNYTTKELLQAIDKKMDDRFDRIEEKLETKADALQVQDHETRLRWLEQRVWTRVGFSAAVAALISAVGVIAAAWVR